MFNATVIEHSCYFSRDVRIDTYEDICKRLKESNKFHYIKWAERLLFSSFYRETGSTFRTFELVEEIECSIPLVTTNLSGKIRVLVTIYRAGFIVVSLVYSIIQQKSKGEDIGKNLIATEPLTSLDINYLLEKGAIPALPVPLKYKVSFHGVVEKIDCSDLLEYISSFLKMYDVKIQSVPRQINKIVYCWNFSPPFDSFSDFIEENYEDLFLMFATPQDGRVPRRSKQSIVKDLKNSSSFSSRGRGILVDPPIMLIFSRRKVFPSRILYSSLLWLIQLVWVVDFMLKFYTTEIRKITSELVSATSKQYSRILRNVVNLRVNFSLALEDLYWAENDLKGLRWGRFFRRYKQKNRLDDKKDALHRRFTNLQSRCSEELTALEHERSKKREESITILTLVFAIFGLGEILSTFLVWYFNSILLGKPAPMEYLIAGLVSVLLMVFGVFGIVRWYLKKTGT